MATTVPIPSWKQFYRVAPESAWNTNTATVDWNIGFSPNAANGHRDVAVFPGQAPFTASNNQIFQMYQAGKRAINQQAPVEGAYTVEGSLEMPCYLELIDPFLAALMGSTARTPTAGTAALASTAFASVATLDTQSDGTEQFKFVIASSTATVGAALINIIQSSATVETITIGTDLGSSVNGDFYSKGAYDGSSNAITFSIGGAVTSGTVVVSGVDLNTNVFTLGTGVPSTLQIEEGGLARAGSNSMVYNGVAVPSMTFAFDRTAADGMLTVTADVVSRFANSETATSYGNDAKTYYHPLQGWTASITKGGSDFAKLVGATFTIDNKNTLFVVSSGNQEPSGAFSGGAEVTGTFNILPEDNTEWAAFTAQTVGDYELLFTSPLDIVNSTKYTLKFEFSELYIEDYTPTHSNDLLAADIAFRTTDDSSDGPVKITSVCRMPV